MSILFLNNKPPNCGVHQYGERMYSILKKDPNNEYIYQELDSYDEYVRIIQSFGGKIRAIIYNYHVLTMGWLNRNNIYRNVKNIGIVHETEIDFFHIYCNIDPDALETSNSISLPRPIYENVDEIIQTPTTDESIRDFIDKYSDSGLPIFGSFGFGFENKGFDRIIKYVNEQYDQAVIKFVIPVAHYDDNHNRVQHMRNILSNVPNKPGIVILITHQFFSVSDLLKFLSSNTMNIFLYDYMYGRGISSTIDYALSVKRPLAISDSYMFRNIYSDTICLYKTPIETCLKTSTEYCSQYLQKYSHTKIIQKIASVL
jgi:hypothetical protein